MTDPGTTDEPGTPGATGSTPSDRHEEEADATGRTSGKSGTHGAGGDGSATDSGPGSATDDATEREPDGPAGTEAAGTEAAERSAHPEEPAALRPRRRWLRWSALAASVLVLASAGTAWSLYKKLDGNIRTDVDTADELAQYEKERPAPAEEKAAGDGKPENILLLGSDNRGDGNGAYGRDEGTQRSDTAILLHIAGDRRSATGVSIPRDLMSHIPSCTRKDGSHSRKQFAQFNWAFEAGGAACTIRTVEKMTGIRVDHHMIVDFRGFKKLVNAVDGVDVCLSEPVQDSDAKLDLPAGRQTLHGEDALGYVRARKSFGGGSDTERIGRQQQFLGSLVKKVRSNGVLLNPGKVYPVLDAATSALTADSGLDSLTELYELVRRVRDIPEDDVRFLTVPRQSYELDSNRDQLVQPEADQLFDQLRHDRGVRVDGEERDTADAESPSGEHKGADGTGKGSDDDGKDGSEKDRKGTDREDGATGEKKGSDKEGGRGSDGPAYRGTTAAHDICATNQAENEAN